MRESDILYETPGGFWVARCRDCYTVFRPSPSGTHSIGDSAYHKTPDGFSLAKARCDYFQKRLDEAVK